MDNSTLTAGQRNTVANLVSRGLGISKENLVISDQFGKNLFDGTASNAEELRIQDLLSQQSQYDARMTELANQVLRDVLGPRKARVTVTTEWDYAQTTRSKEEALGTGAITMQSKMKTDRTVPSGAAAPEAVGITANTVTGSAPSEAEAAEPPEPMTEYSPPR